MKFHSSRSVRAGAVSGVGLHMLVWVASVAVAVSSVGTILADTAPRGGSTPIILQPERPPPHGVEVVRRVLPESRGHDRDNWLVTGGSLAASLVVDADGTVVAGCWVWDGDSYERAKLQECVSMVTVSQDSACGRFHTLVVDDRVVTPVPAEVPFSGAGVEVLHAVSTPGGTCFSWSMRVGEPFPYDPFPRS